MIPQPMSPACAGIDVGVDLRALPGVHQRLLRERPDAQGRLELLAGLLERHRLGGVVGVEAQVVLALATRTTDPADRAPVEDDVVADLEPLHVALAERLDDARGLVAQQERVGVLDVALAVVQIGVAHPARLDLDHGLTGPGIGDDDRLDRDRLALLPGYDSPDLLRHVASVFLACATGHLCPDDHLGMRTRAWSLPAAPPPPGGLDGRDRARLLPPDAAPYPVRRTPRRLRFPRPDDDAGGHRGDRPRRVVVIDGRIRTLGVSDGPLSAC